MTNKITEADIEKAEGCKEMCETTCQLDQQQVEPVITENETTREKIRLHKETLQEICAIVNGMQVIAELCGNDTETLCATLGTLEKMLTDPDKLNCELF